MTPIPKHPSKQQAQQVASALNDLAAQFEGQGDTLTTAAVTLAAEQAAAAAAQTDSGPHRSQLLAAALVNITPRALKAKGGEA